MWSIIKVSRRRDRIRFAGNFDSVALAELGRSAVSFVRLTPARAQEPLAKYTLPLMLLVVAGERGIGRREIEDIGIEGRHGTFSCWERETTMGDQKAATASAAPTS